MGPERAGMDGARARRSGRARPDVARDLPGTRHAGCADDRDRARPAPCGRGETRAVNPISLACILLGVALNAGAQLLLKAGVRAVGHFEFTAANIVPVGLRIASQWPIIGGLACYVISVGGWIVGVSRGDVSNASPMLSLGY